MTSPSRGGLSQGKKPVPPLALRLKPTELCNGNYHRNKTIQSWLNGIPSLYRKCWQVYAVSTERCFYHRKCTLRLKNKVNGQEVIEIHRKCSHCAIWLDLIGKNAHCKGDIWHVCIESKSRKTHVQSITISMNAIYCNKEVYPQSNKPFRCIDIDSMKAITSLLLLCGYTPLDSALELADSSSRSAHSNSDATVGLCRITVDNRRPSSNMFNILPSIPVSRWYTSQLGMGLKIR